MLKEFQGHELDTNLARKFNRWWDLSFALGCWFGERKDGELLNWRTSLGMVSATIKFALGTKRLAEGSRNNEAKRLLLHV